jgi:uroporphyrinogen-III synthase
MMALGKSTLPLIWLNRPQEDSAKTADALAHSGIQAQSIIAPVMQITTLPHTPATTCDGVIITSQYALAALQNLAKTTPIFAVGKSLAARVQALGFAHVYGAENISDLLQQLPKHCPANSQLIYVRGQVVRLDIAAILKAKNHHISEIICYKALPTMSLDASLTAIISTNKRPVYTLFYAIQAVEFCSALLQKHQLSQAKTRLHTLCISQAVADAAKQNGFQNIHISPQADATSMRGLVQDIIRAKLHAKNE